jgi:hypothetical protein
MAIIEQGVRLEPAQAKPEDLAHVRNFEDAPVLEASRAEINRISGDVEEPTEFLGGTTYYATVRARYVFVDVTVAGKFVVLPDPQTVPGKVVTVGHGGPNGLAVYMLLNGALSWIETLGTTGDVHTYLANGAEWKIVGR